MRQFLLAWRIDGRESMVLALISAETVVQVRSIFPRRPVLLARRRYGDDFLKGMGGYGGDVEMAE
jgi:hypothetical protein